MTPEFSAADIELLQQAADWPEQRALHDLDDRLLCEITRTKGIDFATALLYHAIRSSDDHGPFMRRMDEVLRKPVWTGGNLNATLVIVPGAFYREHPNTGADGKNGCLAAAQLGCRTHIIPTQSVGTSTVNGRIIHDWLRGCDEENVILCSLSKGGGDVKMALAQPDSHAAFRNVVAWINVGGTTSGSPMATWILDRPVLSRVYHALFWLRGQNFHFVHDIARRAGSPLDFKLSAPADLRILHVLGFPLERHLRTRPTHRSHRRLSPYGPNDGATILADSCSLPGLIFPVWGADHYFNTRQTPEHLLAALLCYLGEELNLFARAASPHPLTTSAVTQ
jgi:hypothetical protein